MMSLLETCRELESEWTYKISSGCVGSQPPHPDKISNAKVPESEDKQCNDSTRQ